MFPISHLHPMLVHFPIALVVIGFIAELIYLFVKKEICLTKTGYYLLIIGTLAALAAWLSGELFTSDMQGVAEQVRETHETFAIITLILLLITASIRTFIVIKKVDNKTLTGIAFILYALAALSVSLTGFFGGNLVYTYMMPL